MNHFRSKRTLRDLAASPLGLFVLVIVVMFLARSAWGSLGEYREAVAARMQVEARAAEAAAREARLGEEVVAQESGRAEETAIRETLRMARPGEEVILIVPDRAEEEEELISEPLAPWWRRALVWLGGK